MPSREATTNTAKIPSVVSHAAIPTTPRLPWPRDGGGCSNTIRDEATLLPITRISIPTLPTNRVNSRIAPLGCQSPLSFEARASRMATTTLSAPLRDWALGRTLSHPLRGTKSLPRGTAASGTSEVGDVRALAAPSEFLSFPVGFEAILNSFHACAANDAPVTCVAMRVEQMEGAECPEHERGNQANALVVARGLRIAPGAFWRRVCRAGLAFPSELALILRIQPGSLLFVIPPHRDPTLMAVPLSRPCGAVAAATTLLYPSPTPLCISSTDPCVRCRCRTTSVCLCPLPTFDALP